MTLRRSLKAGSLTLGLWLLYSAAALADVVVLVPNSTVKGAIGGRVQGTIEAESPTDVTVKLGNNTIKVPTGEIASIQYQGQPADMTLAESRESAGMLAEAADLYKKAADAASGKPFVQQAAQFHHANALAELALADPARAAEAIKALDAFVRSNSKGRHIVAALESLARLQLQKGETTDVQKTIDELAKQPQGADRAAVLRARVLAKKGEHEKAIAEYDTLIKASKEGSVRQREAQLAKAESLAALKKYDAAEKEVRAFIESAPPEDAATQSAAYNTLGDCLHAANKPKDALLAYYHTDILYSKDKEQHPRALAHIVRIWREMKRDERAEESLQKLKQDYPQSPWVAFASGSGGGGAGR